MDRIEEVTVELGCHFAYFSVEQKASDIKAIQLARKETRKWLAEQNIEKKEIESILRLAEKALEIV